MSSRLVLAALLAGVCFQAPAFSEEELCAVVTRGARGAQIIPEKGQVIAQVKSEQGVACGAMAITHEEPLWIRLSNQTVVKLGPDSFLEVSRTPKQGYKLYRGSVLLAAPSSVGAQTWSTPNAELIFQGGVAVLQYLAHDKTSVAGCFNRRQEFRNKFNPNASQPLSAGEVSRLAIQEGRVRPTHPSVMHQDSVLALLGRLALPEEERQQMADVVRQVLEDRAKSLVSGMKEWTGAEAPASRGIASIEAPSGKEPVKSVDAAEAEFALRQLRMRIYGSEEEQKRFIPPVFPERNPASSARTEAVPPAIVDGELKKQKELFEKESRRIEKEIERLKPGSFD